MKKLIIALIFLNSFQIIYSPIKVVRKVSNQEYVDMYAKKYNLDSKLIKAIISFESDWNYKLRNSKSSAYGLPQFIKSTGKWVAKETGYKNYKHYETTSEQQINMMCWYVKYLEKKYNGNTNKMLIEYNGNELKNKYIRIIKNRMKKEV